MFGRPVSIVCEVENGYTYIQSGVLNAHLNLPYRDDQKTFLIYTIEYTYIMENKIMNSMNIVTKNVDQLVIIHLAIFVRHTIPIHNYSHTTQSLSLK